MNFALLSSLRSTEKISMNFYFESLVWIISQKFEILDYNHLKFFITLITLKKLRKPDFLYLPLLKKTEFIKNKRYTGVLRLKNFKIYWNLWFEEGQHRPRRREFYRIFLDLELVIDHLKSLFSKSGAIRPGGWRFESESINVDSWSDNRSTHVFPILWRTL